MSDFNLRLAPQAEHHGFVGEGFQMASGGSVGQEGNPFPDATLRMQARLLKAAGVDLEAQIPDLFWGTVNVVLGYKLRRATPDLTVENLDWTAGAQGPARIAPETFSFTRCRLAYGGRNYPGLIYLPHPETKPSTNPHRYNVLEVLTSQVEGLTYGTPASVACRADAFQII